MSQSVTAVERAVTDANAVGECDMLQTVAVFKGESADAFDGAWDHDAFYMIVICKCVFTDSRHGKAVDFLRNDDLAVRTGTDPFDLHCFLVYGIDFDLQSPRGRRTVGMATAFPNTVLIFGLASADQTAVMREFCHIDLLDFYIFFIYIVL